MAKRKPIPVPKASRADEGPATLKDLLDAATVTKLKAQAEAMKEEARQQEEARREREAASRRAEEKRLENDFSHLLNTSKVGWKKYN